MKKNFRRILSLVLSVLFITGMMSVGVTAAAVPVFSLNRVSEDDSTVTVCVKLESGSFKALDFQVQMLTPAVTECTLIIDADDYDAFAKDIKMNGGSVVSSFYKSTCKYSTATTVPCTKAGTEIATYRFKKASSATVTDKDIGLVITACENDDGKITATAVNNLAKCTLSFDLNGGSGSAPAKTYTPGDKIGTLPSASKTGCTFDGWYTAKTGGEKVSADTVISKDMTVYARFTVRTFTLTFDANGGKTSASPKTLEYGSKFGTLPAASKDGSTFDGWYTAKTGGTKVTENTVITKDTTVYARFTAITYKVTFDANGGSVTPAQKTYSYGETYGTLPTPEREGYTFSGWYTAKSGGTKITSDAKPTADTTIYAVWKIKTFTVTFNANGGTVSEGSRSVKYGAKLSTLPVPVRTSYVFDGWYTSKTGGTKVSEDTVVKAGKTYYAHWSVLPGDIDLDGEINSSDALLTLQHSVGQVNLTGESFTRGDVNKDKSIDSADALKILQYSIGQIKSF